MITAELATRDRILNAARQEFLERGYRDAWLRNISKNADVTTGALYGYFKNKEELFGALVSECYNGIQQMYRRSLRTFAELPPEQQPSSMEELSAQHMIHMANYMYDHHDEFKLILCCSQGTEYSDLVEKMALLDEEATNAFAESANSAGGSVSRMPPRLEHILTTGLFTMFFELIVHDVPREEMDEYIGSLVRFYTKGYAGIMGF